MVTTLTTKSVAVEDVNYKTPTFTYLKRLALKVSELFRSVSSSLNNLFKSFENRIQSGSLLSDIDVINNTQDLDNLVLIKDITNLPKETLRVLADNADNKILFFPHIIKGTFRDHIVFFAINSNTQEIIFYDSKGWTVADYGLKATANKLKKACNDYTFIQNVEKEQYDSFNCGVYVIKRIKLLAENENESFKTLLSKNELTYDKAMEARRNGEIKSYSVDHQEISPEQLAAFDEDMELDQTTSVLDGNLGRLGVNTSTSPLAGGI